MKRFINIGDKIYSLIFLALLVGLWFISVELHWIEDYVLPNPVDVVKSLYNIRNDIYEHIVVTMKEAIYGLLIAVIFSIIIAFIMDQIYVVKKALFPIFLVSQTIPLILLAPLFNIWFGFSMTPKIIIVVIVCFFPIVVSLNEGLEAVDKDEIYLLQSMGASGLKIFRIVKLPSAMISFFSGLKVAATYSFMGAVISEWMGGRAGLGIYYSRAVKSYDNSRVFAVVFIIIIMSMLIYYIVTKMQQLLMPFNYKRETEIKK